MARKLSFQEALECIHNPVSIFDADQCFVAGNHAYKDLHQDANGRTIIREGLTFRELAQWRLDNGFWRTPPIEIGSVVDGLVDQFENRSTNFSYELADGRSMLVAHHYTKDGSHVSTWSDVTALRAEEAKRRELEAQLHHAHRIDALGRLAGGIAHDLNNALVPVLALTARVHANLLQGSRERGMLDLVIKGGERAKALVRQILDFSRKERLERGPVDLSAVVHDAMSMMRAVLPATIEVATKIAPVATISANAGQIHQVVVNLVTNAAQSIGLRGGTIRVIVESAGDRVRLSIIDDGPGMDASVRAHLFEPFFTTKPVGQGTGLGLAVVFGIVTNHDGTITVNSEPNAGARFDILLPVEAPITAAA
jgi:signal transduction histidine kinase